MSTASDNTLRHAGFFRMWAGETISYFGSAVTLVALPLTAVLVLGANEQQMGWLTACGTLPFLLVGLPAGAWLDTRTRRPVLVAMSLIRGFLLLTVPLAVAYEALTLGQLYVVQFGVACALVVDGCAHRAYLPVLIGRDRLVDANSKLSISGSVADAVGPGVAGYLIQFFSAPYAIFIDAMTYFAAAGMYASIPDHEPAPNPPARDAGLLRRVAEGLSTLWGHRDLRAIMLCGATHNICSTAIRALFILYMSDELGLGPEAVGLVFACGGVGSIVGGSLAPWLQRRFGTRTALVGSQSLTGFARGLIPVAASFPGLALPILCTSSGLLGVARPVFNVIQLSLRGRAVPDHLQGRVTASFGFLMWGFTPLGALVGGYAGATFGMRPTLIVAAIGVVLATGWLASIRDEYRFSPAPGSGNRGESATSPE